MSLESLDIENARSALKQGNWGIADELYAKLSHNSAHKLEALSFLAYHRFVQERYQDACQFSEQVLELKCDDNAKLNLALAEFGAEKYESSEKTLASLASQDSGFGLLLKAGLLQKKGLHAQAIGCFESFFRATPVTPHTALPPLLRTLAKQGFQLRTALFRERQLDILTDLIREYGQQPLQRIVAAAEHLNGNRKPWQDPLQQPSFFYVPGLKARPWFDRQEFNWCGVLESQHEQIFAEYQHIVTQEKAPLKPYVTEDKNAPKDSWTHLIDSNNWLSLHLYKGGKLNSAVAHDAPKALAALHATSLPMCKGNAPEAFFSTLAPKTHIPPHFGLCNFKLVAHLALRIPEHCGIRVGNETRHWQEGQCLIFDDSFRHEAWNQSELERTVLIFDTWHPDLNELERQAISQLFLVIDAYYCNELSLLT